MSARTPQVMKGGKQSHGLMPAQATRAQARQNLEEVEEVDLTLQNEMEENDAPTTDLLSTLKLLREGRSGANSDSGRIDYYYDKETKWMKLAHAAKMDNPYLSMRFGEGLDGTIKLASYLRKKHEEKELDEMIHNQIDKAKGKANVDLSNNSLKLVGQQSGQARGSNSLNMSSSSSSSSSNPQGGNDA